MKRLLLFAQKCLLPCVLLSLQACSVHSAEEGYPGKAYLEFPRKLSAETPYDVDLALDRRLVKENNIDEAQRLFDILSWQQFISLNWPRDAQGQPQSSITGTGDRLWEHWKESFEIFLPDGSTPKPWGAPEALPPGFSAVPAGAKILYRASKMAAFHDRSRNPDDIADEMNQAFTAPIWDQNGNMVRYEVRLNKVVTDYLVSNELYNLDGQIAFSKAGKQVSFPIASRNQEGIMEVKVAWKVLDPVKDIAERYYAKDAYVANPNGSFSKVKVGMIGMHISSRTESSPQWVWATFEHVDNLETNPLKTVNGKKLRPSFYDPNCPTCPVNTFPDTPAQVLKNQIQRVLPIPAATRELNRQVQALLAEQGSFWQYYQLIGTQWSTDPSSAPYISSNTDTSVYTLPQAVTNKSGGKPVPAYLTNMIMETYFQGGTTPPNFNIYLGNEPAYFQIQGFPQTVDTANTLKQIFGTESCVGCHFSSSIAVRDSLVLDKATGKKTRTAIFGNPGAGNFEWLMQLKAHFKTAK
ncbi:hypothetical protein V9K67_10140 [Paraflavisolibacter sp. H34]|uniref:hypothetical protein n=1 Tax=Huijunlia imazamoxiresistens TaxID=3127457 RepID=UPI003017A31C